MASRNLYRIGGPATPTGTRRSVAHLAYDHDLKRRLVGAMRFPPACFDGAQRQIVGTAMGMPGYGLLALAVLPDHVHAVIAEHRQDIRRVVGHLKSQATRALRQTGWPADRPVWGDHGWNVYLDTADSVRHAIEYVRANPANAGLPEQHWGFTTDVEF